MKRKIQPPDNSKKQSSNNNPVNAITGSLNMMRIAINKHEQKKINLATGREYFITENKK